ncbi:Hsp90 co-chaperone Cdc37 [Gryllus bimaculatus]|nr:Hsp90 co-chaperone Cdc37 [Gryllus bimaculatus]
MVDYSKWKDIEISDDEDETHPNIDTPSLFRWRHQARLQRMEELQKEREELAKSRETNFKKIQETKDKVSDAEKKGAPNLDDLKTALKELEKEANSLKQKESEFEKKEKVTPWNVDTISHAGFTKTVINAPPSRASEELSEEQKEQRMKKFVKENEKTLKKFGMLRRFDDSKRFLQEQPHLVCEDTANYLVIWCINLEMDGYILELSKQLNVDPRACVSSFFTRIQVAEPEYKNSFNDELDSFKERIRKRAAEKIQEAEEEERKARLGPGGLDPVEVFETLPSVSYCSLNLLDALGEALQKCFETQDIPLLQETIAAMPEEEARYHMKRCVDSGLWVPDAKKAEQAEQAEQGDSAATESPEVDTETK